MASCIGLWLFTRILIPDAKPTLTITLALWALARIFDEEEGHHRTWAYLFAACLGLGLLLKSLIAVVFHVATGVLFCEEPVSCPCGKCGVGYDPWKESQSLFL